MPDLNCTLTAGNFAEMYELGMRVLSIAGGLVGMTVALVQPWVIVTRETCWGYGTGFHAMLQTFELSRQLITTRYIGTLIYVENLHCRT